MFYNVNNEEEEEEGERGGGRRGGASLPLAAEPAAGGALLLLLLLQVKVVSPLRKEAVVRSGSSLVASPGSHAAEAEAAAAGLRAARRGSALPAQRGAVVPVPGPGGRQRAGGRSGRRGTGTELGVVFRVRWPWSGVPGPVARVWGDG